jgi:UDP-GlcNAc:undecaprenyl-phosphate GlcNAc-1-phosphate transferase
MLLFNGLDLDPFAFAGLGAAGSLVAAGAASLLAGPASRLGLVSRRRRDRFGVGRVPLTGGPALLLGILPPLALLGFPLTAGQAVALVGFFAVGLVDDLKELAPAPKFGAQAAVALLTGFLLVPPGHAAFAAVVFLFLVNACNYLDNMDALLPGVALVQAVTLLLLAFAPPAGAPLLVWGLPAILFLTVPPARLYLGDSGSHLVGAALGVDSLRCLFSSEGIHPRLLLPLGVLFALQIADVAQVTASRLRRRRPIFRGGTDHLSHLLVRRGFPVPRAVLVLVLASGVCGVASLLLSYYS